MNPEQTYQTFTRLLGTGLDRWLDAEIARCSAALVDHTEAVAIYRMQGRIRVLTEMRKALESVKGSN